MKIVIIALAAVLVLAACDSPQKAERLVERAKAEQRFKDWAYVAQTKKLSENEELSLVVVPSSLNEIMDVKCLIYKNRDYQQVIMQCPEARQQDLDVPGEQ